MPLMEITAMSVVPPPMSTTMFPKGFSIGRPAPIAAAMACSTRYTSLAPARYAVSCTARFSTGVISLGTPMTMRGRTSTCRLCAFWMKCVSIFSVTLKSAITPSFIGLMATTFPGVRPSISFASRPTATTSPVALLMATMEGSFTTIPLPAENTSVFAVPRSMARSDENRLKIDRKLYPFLFISPPPAENSSPLPARQFLPRLRSSPPTHCLRTPRSAQSSASLPAVIPLFRNNDRYLLLRRPSPAVLPNNYNGMLPRLERHGEMPEAAVPRNVRHRLAVDDQCRARLGPPDNLRDAPMKLCPVNRQHHLLGLALRHQSEFEGLADFAGLLLGIGGDDVPKIVAGVESRQFRARSCHTALLGLDLGEHRGGADAQRIGHRVGHRLPFKMHGGGLRNFCGDGFQVSRQDQIRGRQDRRFLNCPAGWNGRFLPLLDLDLLPPMLHLRAAAGHHDVGFFSSGIVFHAGPAIGPQLKRRVFRAHSCLRVRRRPSRRPHVHRADVDTHGHARGLVVAHRILFHRNQRIGLHGVCRAVSKHDTRRALRAGLDEIALVERSAIVRVCPLHRIDLLYLHPAVEIHEFRLSLGVAHAPRVNIPYGFRNAISNGGKHAGNDEIERSEDDHCAKKRVNRHRLVGDGVPIHLDTPDFRRGRGPVGIDGCLCGHEYSRANCAKFTM